MRHTHSQWLNIFIIAFSALLTACGQPVNKVQGSSATQNGGLSLPFSVTALPNPNNLNATLDCPNGTSVSMTINRSDNTVSGSCANLALGSNETFKIIFTYGTAKTVLAYASKTADVNSGTNPTLSFNSADYTKPDDDGDGFTNLDEIAAGTDPSLPNYSKNVTVDALPFTISSLSNPADLAASLHCPDGASVSLNTDAKTNTASGNCSGLMDNLSSNGSQRFTITFTDTSTSTILASGNKYSDVVAGSNPALNFSSSDLDGSLSNLVYSTNPGIYIVNQAMLDNIPHNDGGVVASYDVTPSLPNGLSLNTSTGFISGAPTQITSGDYTVTATNTVGKTDVVLHIVVNDVPPTNLRYSANPAVYTVGDAVNITPNNDGGPVVSYSIASTSPPLPNGLTLDAKSGIISGSTSDISDAKYDVVATNTGGSTTTSVQITVNDVAPSKLAYFTNPVTYLEGVAISTPNMPSSSGGTVVSYTVIPSLPAGLILNTSTGEISGTPKAISGTVDYTVTAKNSGGSTTAKVTITVSRFTIGTKDSIAAGEFHSCALVNGGVRCWGANDTGQLGNRSVVDSSIPVIVKGLMGVQAITAGSHHNCAIANGGVYCWGYNAYGQLGDHTNNTQTAPVPVPEMSKGVQAIVAGYNHTCALVAGGVQCWGDNTYGQLGTDPAVTSSTSIAHSVDAFPSGSGVQAIVAGANHTCALLSGAVECWGDNSKGQLGVDPSTTTNNFSFTPQSPGLTSNVQAITAGYSHTCALVAGAVQCWGDNSYGQLGVDPTSYPTSFTPQLTPLTSGVQAIIAGDNHTCAMIDGGVQCWGDNSNGQIGVATTTVAKRFTPELLNDPASGVQALTAGSAHTCALVNGAVKCWGANSRGQLGDSTQADNFSPVNAQGLINGIQGIASGHSHTCVLLNGGVQCWGADASGQLGVDPVNNPPGFTPVPVTNLTSGVQAITAGDYFTCALVNGGVQCWGDNSKKQLGIDFAVSTLSYSSTPQQVNNLTTDVQAISSGSNHTCAIAVNGGVQCWGDNSGGQLGTATTTATSSVPIFTDLTIGVQMISTGYQHSCAVVNGGVRCWGDNSLDQLGADPTTTPSNITSAELVDLPSGSGVQAIVSGYFHNCVLVNIGMQCWGYNGWGQLGDGSSTTMNFHPVSLVNSSFYSDVYSMTAGPQVTCSITDGSVPCAGQRYGLTGPYPNTLVNHPTTDVEAVSAGWNFACALINGTVQCWGENAANQLGTDPNVTSASDNPVLLNATWP